MDEVKRLEKYYKKIRKNLKALRKLCDEVEEYVDTGEPANLIEVGIDIVVQSGKLLRSTRDYVSR